MLQLPLRAVDHYCPEGCGQFSQRHKLTTTYSIVTIMHMVAEIFVADSRDVVIRTLLDCTVNTCHF